nr:hypothetical protein [Tanacetum cinerariifolium]
MGEPLSADHVFDFSMDEPEPHPAYDFFAPGPLPGYAVIDVEEDIAMLFGDDDFSDENSEGFEDDEDFWEVNKEWLMALVTPPLMLVIPPLMIEDLSAHMGNLEYGHGQLVKKVIQVSDAEVADGIAIGEISSRVSAVKGQVQVMASQMVQAVGRLEQVELSEGENVFTHAMDSCASNLIPIDYMERILCLSQVEARLVEFKTQEIKFCEKIRGLEFDVEVKNNKIKHLMNELEQVKKEKDGLDSKLTGFKSTSKDLDTFLGSQRSDKNKEGLGYSDVPPPAQVYSPPKKDIIESNTSDLQSNNSSVSERGESSSSIMSKPMIKFVKAANSPTVIKTNKVETARKSPVKYAEMYRNTSKSPKVRGNQRNWDNLKSQQLRKDFLMKNKACFKCGHFDHLAYDCGVWVEKGKNWPKNNFAHKNVTPRADLLKTGRTPIAVNRTKMNVAQPKRTSFAKTAHSYYSLCTRIDNSILKLVGQFTVTFSFHIILLDPQRRATRIAQSKALPTDADEPASLLRDNSQGEDFLTVFGFDTGHDRENIIKTSALPYELTPRVTSLDADEGTQDLGISGLKARIKLLEDKDKGSAELSGDDAPIKGRKAANILTSGVAAVSIPPVAEVSTIGVTTVSGLVPTEEMAREDQRMNKQIARDAKIARIHAEEELKIMINGLDRSNEMIAKNLHEYEQAVADLTIGEKIELINELVKYQDHHEKILKGITLEEIKEKFIPVWKQLEDFVPMSSTEEGKRMKRKGLKLDEESAKRMKTSEEDLKEMM